MRLNSEAEKSQLNLGYLIHQTGNTRGAFRGTGFELRTDAYGAICANQGLYLTSWGQLGASGDQLDLTPARQQLDSAYQLADTLRRITTPTPSTAARTSSRPETTPTTATAPANSSPVHQDRPTRATPPAPATAAGGANPHA
ncbi:type VI secretion system Vgr family protein [Salinicola aestuarinus]|uniref:type VI secretion system Vgr family protein n=1 Tax=Salinicola aestuarinus TaxID=1949082 RepID=UPI001FD932B0|nr:type VI secretion system Vgr family protein [Salinicola aestuarinus]